MNPTVTLIRFVKPVWRQALLSLVLSTATIASSIGLLGTSAYLISRAAMQPSIAALQVAIVGVRFFGISRGVFRYLERLTSHSVNFHLLKYLRIRFFQMIEPRIPAIFMKYPSGELMVRSTADIDTLENFHSRVILPPLVAFFITCGVSIFVGKFHPLPAIILAAGMAISGTITPWIVSRVNQRGGRDYLAAREKTYGALVEDLQGMAETISFGFQKEEMAQAENLFIEMEKAQSRMIRGTATARSLGAWMAGLTLWAMLFVSNILVQDNRLDSLYLAVLATVTLASFEAITPMGETATYFESCQSAAQRMLALEQFPVTVKRTGGEIGFGGYQLEVRDLKFSYGAGFPELLRGISFVLPEGKRMGLTGANGSGKTTLFNLILGMMDYKEGLLRIGNVDIREISSEELRKKVTLISQDTYIFSGTIRDNLLPGNPNANDDQLISILERVELMEWYKTLPYGLNTWVGEHGVLMSGGERRRMIIARALLKNADMYLIDEPTRYLDPITEEKIRVLINQVTKERSVIWVSHHLLELKEMDEIIVLDEGKIIERGNYSRLIGNSGWFSKMAMIQSDLIPDLPGEDLPGLPNSGENIVFGN